MVRGGLSVLTIAFFSALWIASELNSSERMDFRMHNRAYEIDETSSILLNSPMGSSDTHNRFTLLREKYLKIIQHNQDLLRLQERATIQS